MEVIHYNKSMHQIKKYIFVVFAILIYSFTGIFTKLASGYEFLSLQYIGCLIGAFGVIGVYAILWQQIIKHIDVGVAYMFKGCGLIFGLLICHYVFDEFISVHNIIGSIIIIAGIVVLGIIAFGG